MVWSGNVLKLIDSDQMARLQNRYAIQSDISPQTGQTATQPNVWFVDATRGNDTNDGRDPAFPKKTITNALGSARDDHDDVILARGSFAEIITITKSKIHLLGIQAAGSQLGYLTRLSSIGSAGQATILIQARDVEIGFLEVLGNRDAGQHHPAIFVDGDNNGTRAYIHDCFIPNLTPSGTQYNNGINIIGDRTVVERCIFDSLIIGILVNSVVQATYEIIIKDCIFYACDVGVSILSIQEATGQHGCFVLDCTFDAQGANSEDRAIKVASGTPTLARNHIAGYTTPFTNGSAKLVLNYNQTGGGTLLT